MQARHPQSKRLVTYGKSSRSQPQANANNTSSATSEQRNPKRIPSQRSHTRSTDPSRSKGQSSRTPASSVGSDVLTRQHSADIEVYDVSFSTQPVRRKRKRPGSDPPDDSAIFDPPSHDDNPPTPSSHSISSKPHAPALSDTATGQPRSARKRLVDSLCAAEPPGDKSVPVNARDSRSPSTPSRPSSRRSENSNPNPHETEPYNSGSQQSAAPSPAHLRSSRVTYGRQRSYLNECSFSNSVEGQALLPEDDPAKQARPGREAAHQSNLYADHEENEDGGSVRGIHELRQAGENARFRGTVDSIFEDIEDALNSKSDPCNGFAQLCGKLSGPHMIRRFCECGFEKRFLQSATTELDTLSASFALCAYELIRSGGVLSSSSLAPFLPALLDLSSGLLCMDDDIVALARKRRRSVVSKAAQSFVPRLSTIIHEDATSKVSPRLVALRCIQSVLSNYQETGDSVGASAATLLNQLVDLLLREMPSGTEDFDMPPENFQVLVLTLSSLEICTALSGTLVKESLDSCRSLSQASNILDTRVRLCDNDQYQQVLVLYIRVILNITNSDPSFCEAFSAPKVVGGLVNIVKTGFGEVSEGSNLGDNSLNAVILALGALTNVAEKCTSSRAIFLTPTSGSVLLLDMLLELFSASVGSVPEAHSLLEVHHNVAIGYLSILLVTLSLDREARSVIRKSLDGKGLTVILSTVKEFLQYHRKVEQDLQAEKKANPASGFTVRLQNIVSEIEGSGV